MDLQDQPGHLIRRAQQIAVARFAEALGRELTPVQYAILRRLQQRPGIDQVTLAREVALDTSTAADIAARLENKGWILRELLPRRQRRLLLTPQGEALLARLLPAIEGLNATLLGALDAAERELFMALLRKFVRLNEARAEDAEPRGAAPN